MVAKNVNGTTLYVDFERMRKHDGFVYFWQLDDYLKPNRFGDLSAKTYVQGDCKLFRYKFLSGSFHKEPMGGGTGEGSTVPESHKAWRYPYPNSGT